MKTSYAAKIFEKTLDLYTIIVYNCTCKEGPSMKRRDLIKKLEAGGFKFERNGHKHDVYKNAAGEEEQVPRHREINEILARSILKRWGL